MRPEELLAIALAFQREVGNDLSQPSAVRVLGTPTTGDTFTMPHIWM